MILSTSCFTYANLKINDFDYLNPACVFGEVFLFSELVCLANIKRFEIIFHYQTLLIVLFALTLFTTFSYFLKKKTDIKICYLNIEKINVQNKYTVFLIALHIITIIAFIKYLYNITDFYNIHFAYNGKVFGLPNIIKLYDTLTKFWVDTYQKIDVRIPLIYRIGNPISYGFSLIYIYIIINNYFVDKKINPLHVINVLLLCVNIYINGSRSPLFRLLTMAILLFYIYSFKNGKRKRQEKNGQLTILLIIVGVLLVFGMLMIAVMSLIGRNFSIDKLGEYLFTYLGAPLVNFDNYIAKKGFMSHTWLIGAQTFKSAYNYIGKWTHNTALLNYPTINVFTYSNNGIEIGNVYSTFYPWIYDLGLIGLLLIIPVILYYCVSYRYILLKPLKTDKISFSLFIYAYLFNDLVMLIFSNRFYETVFDPGTIKLLICAYICNELFVNNRLKFIFDKIKRIKHES